MMVVCVTHLPWYQCWDISWNFKPCCQTIDQHLALPVGVRIREGMTGKKKIMFKIVNCSKFKWRFLLQRTKGKNHLRSLVLSLTHQKHSLSSWQTNDMSLMYYGKVSNWVNDINIHLTVFSIHKTVTLWSRS